MNIDELKIGEAKEIAAMFGAQIKSSGTGIVNHGLCIVVLDKWFVYVGQLMTDDKFLTIMQPHVARRWGTTRGLGQLVLEGPQPNPELDNCGTVRTLIGELKHMILCEVSAWENK